MASFNSTHIRIYGLFVIIVAYIFSLQLYGIITTTIKQISTHQANMPTGDAPGGPHRVAELLAGNVEWEAIMKDHGDASLELLKLLSNLPLEKIKGTKEPASGEGTSNKTKTLGQARLEESEHPFPAASMKGGASQFEMMVRRTSSARQWKFFTRQWNAPEDDEAMARLINLHFTAYANLHRWRHFEVLEEIPR